MRSKVAVIKVNPQAQIKEIYSGITDAINLLGNFFDKCPKKGTILLKPNYGAAKRKSTVNPIVTHATAKILVERGFKVLIGEDPGFRSKSAYEKWKKYVQKNYSLKEKPIIIP